MESPEEFRRRAGRVEIGPSYDFQSRGGVIRDLVLASLLLVALVTAGIWFSWPALMPLSIGLPALLVYCTIAYFVRARPNHDQMGGSFHLGYRPSADVNWQLVQLVIILAPGRFISVGIVDGVRLLVRGRLPHERLLPDDK